MPSDRIALSLGKALGIVVSANLLVVGTLLSQQTAQVKELGIVHFGRDLDAGLAIRPNKPIFLCFQEVPG